MMTEEIKAAQEIAKTAPPVSIAGAKLFGVVVADWLLVLTLIYIVCQIIVISPKVYRTLVLRHKK